MAASYLIETKDGLYLVDAGFLGTAPLVHRAIRAIGRRPEELRLVLVTHPHLDHFGGLARLHDEATFEIVSHPDAAASISTGGKEFSPGLTPFAKWVGWLAATSLPHMSFRGAGPVRGLHDGHRLHDLGLPARVLHTPGHTESCITLVLDDGTAFTGDLVQGVNPLTGRPSAPSMAWSLPAALRSWRRLLDEGVERLLPAHGGPLGSRLLGETLSRSELLLART
jgi:glyoxylase-like metal-dependent hydrolase (beta-lactamase superfamily II)